MKPLNSVGSFIEPFCARELMIVDQLREDKGGKQTKFVVL